MPKLQQRNQELTRQREPLANRINNFVSRYPYTNFKYTDPTPNFDRSRIYGCICKLIKIKSPEVAFALEIAAGGRVIYFLHKTNVHNPKDLFFSYLKL